jgi:hypothetical protein
MFGAHTTEAKPGALSFAYWVTPSEPTVHRRSVTQLPYTMSTEAGVACC